MACLMDVFFSMFLFNASISESMSPMVFAISACSSFDLGMKSVICLSCSFPISRKVLPDARWASFCF